jgi:multisubunit Na+/H+ antiporter MnhF subunit
MIALTLILLGLAFMLFFGRLLLGPSLTDRVMALDGMIVCGIATLAVRAVDTGNGTFLPVAVVFTMVGFIGTAVVARFIEGQGG